MKLCSKPGFVIWHSSCWHTSLHRSHFWQAINLPVRR